MRKTILVLALFFCGALSLAALSRINASIYIAPVTGRGSKPDDNSFFYNKLFYELTIEKVIIANTQKDAEYSLIGTVGPYWNTGQFTFHLALQDNRTGAITVEGDLRYFTPEDTDHLFSVLVTSLIFTIPAVPVPADPAPPAIVLVLPVPAVPVQPEPEPPQVPGTPPGPGTPPVPEPPPLPIPPPRYYWLFLDLGIKWTPDIPQKDISWAKYSSFQLGPSLEFHFSKIMSLESGVEAQFDGVKVSGVTQPYYSIIIGVPLLIKLNFKPGANSMLEPYLGPYFNILHFSPQKDIKPIEPALISARIGLQYSVKVGPGLLSFDGGLTGDVPLNNPLFKSKAGTTSYGRYNVHIGLGYKFGFIQKETK
jgi:hypothetical protein